MRYKALPLSVFTAATLVATPAMAQVEPVADDTNDTPINDVGVGDAEVRLQTPMTSPVLPDIDAWVHLMWVGDAKLDAREFQVTAEGSEGVEVGYPLDHEDAEERNRDFSSLYDTSVLPAGAMDFTALRLVVDKDAVEPRLKVTLSYVSDAGPATETFEVAIPFDETEFTDAALDLATGPLGEIPAGDAAWFDVEMTARHNAGDVQVRVTEPSGFGVVYPNVLDHSKLDGGTRIVVEETDVAAIRFDTRDLEPGEYEVTIEVSYQVGFTTLTQEVTRTIVVTAVDDETDNSDDDTGTGDEDDTDTGDGDDTGAGDDTGDGDDTDTGDDGDDTDTGDDSDDDDSDSDDDGTDQTGPITVATLADGIDDWTVDPYGTDTATTGIWGFGQPDEAIWNGITLELGSTPSGNPGLFTLSGTGTTIGDHDLDDGESSILSPTYALPEGKRIRLDFSHYFSYLRNATPDDSLMVMMITEDGDSKMIHLERATLNTDKDARWSSKRVDLTAYAGQDVRFLIVAGDRTQPSYVEAAIDGFTITAE